MTDQIFPLPAPSAPAARRSPDAGYAHRQVDPAARDAQSARLLAMEASSLAGAAPTPGTALRLIGVLFRAAQFLMRARDRQSW